MNVYENSPHAWHSQTAECRDDQRYKEYRVYRLVAVSFGILCVLQGTLNISLRLSGRSCPKGWLSFASSCYYISFSHMNWTGSREQCRERGADLAIINSQDEQEFVKALSVQAWIGLSYDEKARVWKWVDGAPLIKGTEYWSQGEPNNWKGKREDCAQTWPHRASLETWNDDCCASEFQCICEKSSS